MNLFIVEDELMLQEKLVRIIPWEENGIRIDGVASNGLEALEQMERRMPDIMLFDIQMPQMDGLSLAEQIHGKAPHIRMIILSGHDDFQYAQKALELGVTKYLLKPAGEEEILEAVLAAAQSIRTEAEERHHQDKLRAKWNQHLPVLQEMFCQNWVKGNLVEWEIVQKSRELLLEIRENQLFVGVVFQVDPLSDDETRFTPKDAGLLEFSLQSIAKELLTDHRTFVFPYDNGLTGILFSSRSEESSQDFIERVNHSAEKLLLTVKECLKVTASGGIGSIAEGPAFAQKSFRHAQLALTETILHGTNLAIPYRERAADQSRSTLEYNIMQRFEVALDTMDQEKVEELLLTFLAEGVDAAESVAQLLQNVLFFNSSVIRYIQLHDWKLEDVFGEQYMYLQQPVLLTTKQQVMSWTRSAAASMIAYARNHSQKQNHELVTAIIGIVERELDNEFTLNDLAARVYCNASYLSRLFKQVTGKAFSQYVLEKKMGIAKEMLQQGMLVCDAAERIGYKDSSYFTRVFRKYYGFPPGELKR